MAVPLTLSSVPAQTPYAQFVATAGQTVFPYPFEITQDSDLVVVTQVAGQAPIQLNTDQGYTVTGQGTTGGGNFTFAVGLAVGTIVTAYRDIQIARITQLSQNGTFFSSNFNNEFNRVYLILQQLFEASQFDLQIPNTNASQVVGQNVLTPTQYANKYLAFDSNGNPTPAVLTNSGTLTAAIIGGLLQQSYIVAATNPQTAAEIAASVVPTNLAYPELDPRRYGIDFTGTTASDAQFANLLAVAAQFASAFIRFPQITGTMRLDNGFTTDPSKLGIDFGGITIDGSHSAATYYWQIIPSDTNPNNSPLEIAAHPYSNAIFIGPSASVNSTALFLNSVTEDITSVKFDRIQWREWITDIIIGAGTFCCTWTGCQFTQTSGIANTSYSVAISSSAEGERNSFIDCFWFNKFYLMNLQSPNSDTWFQNCSIDTFYRAFNVLAGQCYVNMCHMENVTDVDVWGYAANPALLSITNSIFTTQIAKTVYDFFTSGSGNTGGVVILNCALNGGGRPLTTYLVGGGGNTRVAGLTLASGDQHPSIGPGANLLAYGTMESSSWAGDWTLSVTGTPTQSNTVAHSGTYSMKLAGSSTTSPGAQATRACVPGQFAIADLWWQAPTMGSSTAFVVALSYTDAAGVLLSGSTNLVNDTAVVSTWTHVQYGLSIAAPPGTVKAILAIYMFGTTAGSPVAYVDDMQFYVA